MVQEIVLATATITASPKYVPVPTRDPTLKMSPVWAKPVTPKLVLVDGSLPLRLWQGPQRTLIRGESKSPEIAAASVIAKEARDVLIKRLAIKFPEYGLEKHVGYGTKIHRQALKDSGPTKLHRTSFLSRII